MAPAHSHDTTTKTCGKLNEISALTDGDHLSHTYAVVIDPI